MSPADKILQKALIESWNPKTGKTIDSAGWSKVQSGLRDRAFFSSQVSEAKILYTMRKNVSDLVSGGKSPSEVRRDLRAYLDSIGYDAGENRGTIKDLMTKARLDVMMKTNADQAKGYASHLRATTAGAILAFPAYELIRVQQRKMPRDWHSRWIKAANAVGWDGVAKDTDRMIALKTSPVWAELSVFGNPFPPFDYNSGMGIRDIAKSVCREIGLLGKDEQPEIPPPPDFNGNLSASVPFDNKSTEYRRLRKMFGDQIQFNEEKREVQWRSDLFSGMFEKGNNFTIELGQSTNALIDDLPSSIPADTIRGKHLTVTQHWLDKKRKDGVTDHRAHFEAMPDEPFDIPLKKGDVDMLPSIWRNPDREFEDKGDLVLEVDAIDGGMFRAIVKPGERPRLKTFYRTTENWEDFQKRMKARST